MRRRPRGLLLFIVISVTSLLFLGALTMTKATRANAFRQVSSVKEDISTCHAAESLAKNIQEQLKQAEPTEGRVTRVTSQGKSGLEATVSNRGGIFYDDFSSLIAGRWDSSTHSAGVVALGHLVLDSSNDTDSDAFGGNPQWRNYRVSCLATVQQGTGLSILARRSEQNGQLQCYSAGYSLLEAPLKLGVFKVDRRSASGNTRLASVTGIDCGLGGLRWLLAVQHKLELVVHNDQITFLADDEVVLTCTDPEPLTEGNIGVQPDLGCLLLVDEIKVEYLEEVRALWKP